MSVVQLNLKPISGILQQFRSPWLVPNHTSPKVCHRARSQLCTLHIAAECDSGDTGKMGHSFGFWQSKGPIWHGKMLLHERCQALFALTVLLGLRHFSPYSEFWIINQNLSLVCIVHDSHGVAHIQDCNSHLCL